MTKNPYDVLGVSPNASDDEIKRAYRDLTRKYHPDANVNNPLADLAEEKFKEVQEAYDTIMKERSTGSTGGYSYGYGGGYNQAQQDPQMQAAINYVNSRHYREALNVLDQIQCGIMSADVPTQGLGIILWQESMRHRPSTWNRIICSTVSS